MANKINSLEELLKVLPSSSVNLPVMQEEVIVSVPVAEAAAAKATAKVTVEATVADKNNLSKNDQM